MLILIIFGQVCAAAASKTKQYTKLSELKDQKIGVILGANHDIFIAEKIPDAKVEYIKDLSAAPLALETGKIAAFANMLPTAIYLTHANQNISFITEPLKNDYNYASFTNSERGRELCAEYEKFLKTLWDDGTIKKLADKWIFSTDDQARIIDNNYLNPPASKGVLKMAVDTERMPFAYVKGNKITGYDIELVSRFCKAMGYGLEVYSMDFGGILGSIKTGKCDLTGNITWTKERAETMLYSQVPNAAMDVVLLVLKDDSQNAAAVLSFFDELKASFARTFIREDRWKLFVDGIANTMIITILSIILGTLLGFAVYLLCRKGLRAALLVTRFFIWLIKGMPMIVLLLHNFRQS